MALQIPTTAEMQNLYAMHSFVRPSAPQIHPHDSTKTPELVDTMASVRADAERPQPTRAIYRAALAALKRHKKTSAAVTAAGGGVASLDMPLHPNSAPRGGIDHQIAWLESRLRPQRLAVRAFPSPKK